MSLGNGRDVGHPVVKVRGRAQRLGVLTRDIPRLGRAMTVSLLSDVTQTTPARLAAPPAVPSSRFSDPQSVSLARHRLSDDVAGRREQTQRHWRGSLPSRGRKARRLQRNAVIGGQPVEGKLHRLTRKDVSHGQASQRQGLQLRESPHSFC